MNWISKTMFRLLMCAWILLRMNSVIGIDTGTLDPDCVKDCACCKNRHCGSDGYWPEGNCYSGCIEGYRGGRCLLKCDYPECAQCPDLAHVCTECKAGYYPGSSNNCSLKCPSPCKTCTSSTNCIECTDEYYNDNFSRDCRHRYCPLHCKCKQNACVSCEDGYFNVSSSCISKCSSSCVSCSAKDKCSSCEEGKYNGYQFDMTDRLLLNNCTHGCRENCTSCSSYNNCSQCVLGKYGMTCQRDCSVGCKNKICQIESGNCYCKTNFSGRNCSDCIPGKFGASCEQTCPMLCKNKRCDKSSGNCLDGCVLATIVGETCNACVNGSYGNVCNATCPKNCKDVNCERNNGECSYGCKDNFRGKKCEACKDGKYGKSCNLTCPQNCADDKCNKTSGHCFACRDNYYGNECNNCTKGYYGSSCNDECSSQCLNGVCNRATGNCDLGCKGNYSGDKCCIQSGNCLNCSSNSECNKCKSGYFSEQCNEICTSDCLDSCDLVTGECHSCKHDMYGRFCNARCSLSCNKSQDANSSRCELKHGNCLHGCVDGFYGPNCSERCNSQCIDKLCMRDTGRCTNGCSSDDPGCTKSSGQKSSDSTEATGPIAGGVVGLIILVTVVIVVAFVYKRRQGKNESSGRNREMPSHTAREEHTYGNITENHLGITSSSVVNIGDVRVEELATNRDETYYNTEQNNNRVNVKNLLTYVTKEHVNSFENEFKNLNKGLDLTENCTFAKKPENIALNRYNGIYPYDHSRVTYPGQPDFFINACYIDGYNRRKAYIASLGPTAKTTDTFATFWSMVWNEKSDIILMLTNLREASGMKCEQYWPKVDKETLYGQIKAKCRSVEEYAEYTVRTFTIAKGEEQRNLLQLHYTAWPDKGVPLEVTSLVEFRQRVKAVPVTFDGPTIVHCSAGVGRTGTYIALDQLTEEGKCEGSVDVFNCVNRMREQRVNMVQTAEQYTFLYKSLVHSLSFGCEALTAEQIQGIMYETGDKMFTKMYQTLRQEVDIESKEEVDARQENRRLYKDKNRRQSDIPGGSSRVRLYLSRKEGQHDYINAVFINSFRIKNLFIAAQSPLPGTIEDFLSMIYQQNSTCVVALEEPHSQQKDVGKYLPADNETYTFGNFTIMSSKCATKPQYVLKKLSIRNEKGEEKTVSHFQYRNWEISKKVPDSAEEFVQFIKEVENCIHRRTEATPIIVVHCLNGYEKSGLFCVVYKLLEKLEAERQVSVVNTVRKIRTHRKQSITSVEQLKFCYQCISAYMEIYNTYSNFAT